MRRLSAILLSVLILINLGSVALADYDDFRNAIRRGDVEALKDLIEGGAHPKVKDSDGFSLLHTVRIAPQEHQVEIATLLLQHGLDPNTASETLGFTP